MNKIVFDVLLKTVQKETRRVLIKTEKEYIHGIASVYGKKFIKELNDEIDKMLKTQNCSKCANKEIGINGICHICKLCDVHKIADIEEFRKFYNNCDTRIDDAKIVYCYKVTVERDGGV